MKKNMIFQNQDLEFWYEDAKQEYPDLTENQIWEIVNEWVLSDFQDTKSLLNKPLEGRVLMIADLGLWNGRRSGYKILEANLSEILASSNSVEYISRYYDRFDVRGEDIHHDGCNKYVFREIREDRNIENLLNKIYNGEEITSSVLSYYTRSLVPYIKNIF